MPDKQCPACEGTGRKKGPSRGRITTYKECEKCGGAGILKPVTVVAAPAVIAAEAKSG